jgi:phosphatidylglycerophosphatase A
VSSLTLFIAQGLGAGRSPVAPGTCGSAVGLLWTAALLAFGNAWCYLVGALAGLGLSVWLCGRSERRLGAKDPPSVVLDEIAAMPLCWAAPQTVHLLSHGRALRAEALWTGHLWEQTLLLFALFRLFDIWKPWPVCQSQRLPGGWGITLDDTLAALYVNLVWLAAFALTRS